MTESVVQDENEALRRLDGGAVLPRFASPYAVHRLWVLLTALALVAAAGCFVRVANYAFGVAIVIKPPAGFSAGADVAILLVAPARYLGELRVGQVASLADQTDIVEGTITSVEPGLLDPEQARARYGLTRPTVARLAQSGPATVAIASPTLRARRSVAADLVGTVVSVKIDAGSRRVVSLLRDAVRLRNG